MPVRFRRFVYCFGLINLVSLYLFTGLVSAAPSAEQAIRSALADPVRSEAEQARDAERKPLETLTFFGLEPDMTVIELLPGSGWYTKILGKTLKDHGQLYEAINTGRIKDDIEQWDLGDVVFLATDSKLDKTDVRGIYDLNQVDFGVDNVDMVLTFRNAHNLTQAARAKLDKAVFDALKPGGIYGIIDHTRRHNEPYSRPVWRRLDPVMVIKELLDAGFIFEGYSDLHYVPSDQLTFDTTAEQMTGPSDRFTLKFKKPE